MMKTQNGRSMVEMLGVLAIIGILSIGAIYGYSYAMNRYRANEIIHQGSLISTLMIERNVQGLTKTGVPVPPSVLKVDAPNITFAVIENDSIYVVYQLPPGQEKVKDAIKSIVGTEAHDDAFSAIIYTLNK